MSRASSIELLEVRRLLATAVAPITWGFSGGDGGDNITVTYRARDARLLATINGVVTETRLAKNVDAIMIWGLDGNDVISVDLHDAGITPGLWINGGAGRDIITGSRGGDLLIGGSGNDYIDAGAGDDQVRGGTGRDGCAGGDGDDYLQGNAHNDTLSGGWGKDLLTGSTGDDQLRGGNDGDDLVGGKGNDTIKGGEDNDKISGGAQLNTLFRQSSVDEVVVGPGDTLADDDSVPPLERIGTDDALKEWIIDRSVDQWKDYFGKKPVIYTWWCGDVIAADTVTGLGTVLTVSGAFDSFTAPPPVAGGDHSTTNTQVAGVDEADTVETRSEERRVGKDC